MPYIIYWFIGWRFSSRSLFSAGFDSEISFLFSWQTRSVWSPLFSSPLLSSEEVDDDDEGSCWTLIWTSLSKDEIGQLITLVFRIAVVKSSNVNKHCSNYHKTPKTYPFPSNWDRKEIDSFMERKLNRSLKFHLWLNKRTGPSTG